MRLPLVSRRESQNTELAGVRETLRTGFWFVPSVFVAGAVVLSLLTVWVDRADGILGWLAFTGGPTSAQQLLTTIATSMMTFTGLVFTITIVALQLASSQFSPRVLRTFLRDRGSQVALGVFTATFVYSLMVLVQVRTIATGTVFVPGISITVAFVLLMASLGTFVFYVNHIAQAIRVVNIIESVAAETRASLDEIFPAGTGSTPASAEPPVLGAPTQVIFWPGIGGVVAGLDVAGLVRVAHDHDCLIELLPHIGDFVAEGATLFAVHAGGGQVPAQQVLRQIGIARERSMRQDPGYGFRQLVDIAEKALSPALNDPTTAVQAIDRLHDLLRRVACRPQPSGVYYDGTGTVRVIRPVMTWPGLVTLAFEEIREYGGTSVQVHRRLHGCLEDLLEIVPPDRQEPLRRQLRLQHKSTARNFREPEERALAQERDDSGLGNEEPA
jgi:uncharacterized membrane protein